MKNNWYYAAGLALVFASCNVTDTDNHDHNLNVPTDYTSANFDSNASDELALVTELSDLATASNDAEANAQNTTVAEINLGTNLANATVTEYKALVNSWLLELVKAANDDDSFQLPGNGEVPVSGEEGGLAGSRLLDENGLELEQMLDKGMYGAALYNHAVALIEAGNLTANDIDKLVAVFGTDASWSADDAGQSAKYAQKRSDNENMTGFFYDMKTNLLTAKAAIDAGSEHDSDRDEALAAFLLNWEKSNFATVINYCNGAKTKLQDASAPITMDEFGSAMHSYSEAVGFAHGFRGVSNKMITDAQIDGILTLLLAEHGETPESYRFANEVSLISNLDQAISDIQAIYGFSDAEVLSFY